MNTSRILLKNKARLLLIVVYCTSMAYPAGSACVHVIEENEGTLLLRVIDNPELKSPCKSLGYLPTSPLYTLHLDLQNTSYIQSDDGNPYSRLPMG